MIKIGITGGIGSGKSVVASLLSIKGIPVYEADQAGKELSDRSPEIREKLIALFGEDIYIEHVLDRKKLASVIFSDDEALQKVNETIHPVVAKDFLDWLSGVSQPICAIESAILFESGFDHLVDVIWMVYAPVEIRMTRVMQRDGVTEADVIKRMNRQTPDDVKRKRADFVIINDDVQAVIPQVDEYIEILSNIKLTTDERRN